MDRKEAFKKARSLINKASTLYALRNYVLEDGINFPLGEDVVQVFKGKKTDFANNVAITAFKTKADMDLQVKLKLEIRRYNDEEIQQVVNSVMRVFRVSVIKKAEEVLMDESKITKQRQINTIGKTNNACIYLLERLSKEILDRVIDNYDLQILNGLSSKVLTFLTIVIRRYMISQGMDKIAQRYADGSIGDYEKGLLDIVNKHQSLLQRIINILKDRGLSKIEQQIKNSDKHVEEYVSNGYTSLV